MRRGPHWLGQTVLTQLCVDITAYVLDEPAEDKGKERCTGKVPLVWLVES